MHTLTEHEKLLCIRNFKDKDTVCSNNQYASYQLTNHEYDRNVKCYDRVFEVGWSDSIRECEELETCSIRAIDFAFWCRSIDNLIQYPEVPARIVDSNTFDIRVRILWVNVFVRLVLVRQDEYLNAY